MKSKSAKLSPFMDSRNDLVAVEWQISFLFVGGLLNVLLLLLTGRASVFNLLIFSFFASVFSLLPWIMSAALQPRLSKRGYPLWLVYLAGLMVWELFLTWFFIFLGVVVPSKIGFWAEYWKTRSSMLTFCFANMPTTVSAFVSLALHRSAKAPQQGSSGLLDDDFEQTSR